MSAPQITVSSSGVVTWNDVTGATGYEISIDGTNYSSAVSGVNYLSTIVATTGTRTVRVRATTTDTNYATPGTLGTPLSYISSTYACMDENRKQPFHLFQ